MVRAENITGRIEATKKSALSSFSGFALVAVICGLLMIFSPKIIAILNDSNSSRVGTLPALACLLVMAAIVGVVAFRYKGCNKVYSACLKAEEYCKAESLILDEEKAFGSTISGSFQLPYDEIQQSECRASDVQGAVKIDLFEIVAKNGSRYTFYSFSNSRELKSIIDIRILSKSNAQ